MLQNCNMNCWVEEYIIKVSNCKIKYASIKIVKDFGIYPDLDIKKEIFS